MGMVVSACRLACIDLPMIDGYAVTAGPGSFTGLRIGISTIKGICFALQKPLTTVPTLEVLAAQAVECRKDFEGILLSLINARRQEVYAGWYRKGDSGLRPIGSFQAAPIDRVLSSACSKTFLAVGDGALLYREAIEIYTGQMVLWPDPSAHVPRASTLVRLGLSRFASGQVTDAAAFAPEYVRKPDIRLPAAGIPEAR
jgi:tRNA threonylcarbamoyladenosine biosynthesis protein TsaB